MFGRSHEQDLAEIRASADQLRLGVDRGLEEVARLEKAQDRLAAARGLARERRPIPARQNDADADDSPTRRLVRDAFKRAIYGPDIEMAPVDVAERAAPERAPLLAFVHIPKTAGGTVNSMFLSVYEQAEVGKAGNYMRFAERTTEKVRRPSITRAKVAIGHVPIGVFRENLPPGTRYMTFLREPIERVLSHYYRHIEPKSATTNSIEEALEGGEPEICNLSTRFLSGTTSASDEVPESALDDAKANLREFAFVGIQERFEESIALLKRMLALGPVKYENQHVSLNRPTADEIAPEQRRLILERNALDAALYHYGLGLFERAVAEAGPGLAAEAEQIRVARVVAPSAQ